jgi:hypothetical protein
LSLSSIVKGCKLCRSISPATQITAYLGIWERSPRSTVPPLFSLWNLLSAKAITSKLAPCKSSMLIIGGLLLCVVPQPLCKGFGRRLQDHHLVEHALTSVACSPENRVSLCGVDGFLVTTTLQRRRTSLKKEETMTIHPCVSMAVISCLYLYLYYCAPCFVYLVIQVCSTSCISSKPTLL